jgi:hypothetical protein
MLLDFPTGTNRCDGEDHLAKGKLSMHVLAIEAKRP